MAPIALTEFIMSKKSIDDQRWNEAQQAEKPHHIADSLSHSYTHYDKIYDMYFQYLNIEKQNLKQKSIAEIGPARIPGLFFCKNYSKSYVIEPTYYPETDEYYRGKNIVRIFEKAENCKFPQTDEIWLLNLLQHVQDPDKLIALCKKNAKTIKFFEPIDYPISVEHPFTFSFEDYVEYFGNSVKRYTPVPGFHQANCVYGVYENNW
jgi:hypothetical protein